MTISYVAQGTAAAVTTSVTPGYPAGIQTGDLLVLTVSSDGSAIGNAPSGWTETASETAAGGLRTRTWWRWHDGTTPSTTVTTTGGTKGVAYLLGYRSTEGQLQIIASTVGTDTDTTSTAIAAPGAAWTSLTGDAILAMPSMLAAAAGTFTGNATVPVVAQAGATVANTARFAARTGTNTIYYAHNYGAVTAGGTGAPTFTATAAGASAAGVAALLLIREPARRRQVPPITRTALARASSW